jgi:hypothetical protein
MCDFQDCCLSQVQKCQKYNLNTFETTVVSFQLHQ